MFEIVGFADSATKTNGPTTQTQPKTQVPVRACDRRVNEFVKRLRALRVHMLLVGAARKSLPAVFGKAAAQRRVLDAMPELFHAVAREHHLPPGDFPDMRHFRDLLATYDLGCGGLLVVCIVLVVMLRDCCCDVPRALACFSYSALTLTLSLSPSLAVPYPVSCPTASSFPKHSDLKLATVDAALHEYVPSLMRAFTNPYN